MKKRIGILLFAISSMSLTGCDFIVVGRKKALERITEIGDNLVYTDRIQSLYAKSSTSITEETKTGDVETKEVHTVEWALKVLTMLNYIYYRETEMIEDVVNDTTTIISETEMWNYKLGRKYYFVNSEIHGNETTKTYTVEKGNTELRDQLNKKISKAVDACFNGEERDEYVEQTIDLIERDEQEEDRSVKYVSYGKGNLSVNAIKEVSETKDGITSSLEENYHFEWKRYALKKEGSIITETKTNEETGDFTKTTKDTTYWFKTFFIPRFPKLKQFNKN